MARGTITINDLTANGVVNPTAHTIVAADGALLRASKTAKIGLRIAITGGTAGTIDIRPGENPPAFRQGLGTLQVVVPATNGVRYLVLESARFVRADGDIYLDFNAGAVGTIEAFRLPQDI